MGFFSFGKMDFGWGVRRSRGIRLPLDDLIFYSVGTVVTIDDATYLKSFYATDNSDVAKVKGASVAFDGSGFGTLTDPDTGAATSVLLPAGDWSEPIEFTFAHGTSSVNETFIASDVQGSDELLIRMSVTGLVYAYSYVGSTLQAEIHTISEYDDGLPHKLSLDYQGGTTSLTVDSETVSASWSLDGNQRIGLLGKRADGSSPLLSGNLWGLSGPGFNLNMACGTDTVHPTVELSATPGGPNCTWSSFAAGIYEEHSDGSGFDLNVLGWTVADGSTMYLEAAHTNLLLADSRIPPGAGFDGAGVALATQFKGPIAASMETVGIPCLLGDGTGYAVLGEDIVLSGDFKIAFDITPSEVVEARNCAITTGFKTKNSGYLECEIGGVWINSSDAGIVLENGVRAKGYFQRIGANITFNVNGLSEVKSCPETDVVIADLYEWTFASAFFKGRSGPIEIYGATGTLVNFYPCEGGEGTILEDTISGNNGILTSFAGDPWSTRDVGRCLMCERGFSVDRLGVGTGVSVCNTDGLHQDGSQPTYPRDTMENVLNAPVLHVGALGPLTQGVAALTAETQISIPDLPFNTGDQLFVCSKGLALYSETQSAENIAAIAAKLCSIYLALNFSTPLNSMYIPFL